MNILRFILIAVIAGFVPVAESIVPTQKVEVVAIQAVYDEDRPRSYAGTATGAGIGGTIGALAAGNNDRATAAALGAIVGGAIGNRTDRKPRLQGFDVVIRDETGRLGSIFMTEPPVVGVGGWAYLVGGFRSTRLIPVPLDQRTSGPESHPAAYY